jgi:hypothetical protein
VFGGGTAKSDFSNIIDYITIASTGNATDFGDLTVVARLALAPVRLAVPVVYLVGVYHHATNQTLLTTLLLHQQETLRILVI